MAYENLPARTEGISRVPNNSPVDKNYFTHHSWQGPLNQAVSYAGMLAASSPDFAKTVLPDQMRPDMSCHPSLENEDKLACLANGIDSRVTSSREDSKSWNALKRCRKSEQGHGSHDRAKRQCLPLEEGEHELEEDWEATEQKGANSIATPLALQEWVKLINQLHEVVLQGDVREGHSSIPC